MSGWIAGVDGCKAGWVAAFSDAAMERMPVVKVFKRFDDIVFGEFMPDKIAVDMPIGFPDVIRGSRGPEPLVRALLGRLRNSVFDMPSRRAIYAEPRSWQGMAELLDAHRKASAVALATSVPPKGCTVQAFCLFDKIREIDALLRSDERLRDRIFEVHPELAFRTISGFPLTQPKKIKGKINSAGMDERRALLQSAGLPRSIIEAAPPRGAGADDVLDALAGLIVAKHIAAGRGKSFPDPPGRDSHGLPIAIWSFAPHTPFLQEPS